MSKYYFYAIIPLYQGDGIVKEYEDRLLAGDITREEILDTSLMYFKNPKIMEKAFRYFFFYNHGDSTYIERFNSIYTSMFKKLPTISMFEELFAYQATCEWKKHRKTYHFLYSNVFLRILAQLNNSRGMDEVKNNLDVIYEMQRVLGYKYVDLIQNMQFYLKIRQSTLPDKDERLEVIKEKIANLCSIYISRSRELFEQRIIDAQKKYLREFFCINYENPYVRKRVYLKTQRDKYKELYSSNDLETMTFINSIIDKYSSELDKKIIITMVNGFIMEKTFKLQDIYPEISAFISEYEFYLETQKLINRLNSKFINYYDRDVILYRDVIGYDEKRKLFYYKGKKYHIIDERKYREYKKYHYVYFLLHDLLGI